MEKKIKRARPLLNHVITTARRYDNIQMKDGLIDASKDEGDIMCVQQIVSLGPNCYTGLSVGQWVLINPINYSRPEHSLRENSILEKSRDEVTMIVSWPTIEIDDRECLFLYDRDIDLIIDEFATE